MKFNPYIVVGAAAIALTAAVTFMGPKAFGQPVSGEWYIEMHVVPGNDVEERAALQFRDKPANKAECDRKLADSNDELTRFVVAETEQHGPQTVVTFACKQQLDPA